jgi:hypothetical protein
MGSALSSPAAPIRKLGSPATLWFYSQPDGSRPTGKIWKAEDTSGGIDFGRPDWRSTKIQLVSPRATTARSFSRRKRYFLKELALLNVDTQVRSTKRSPAKAGNRYSTWWLRTTHEAAADFVAAVHPAESECEIAASCIQRTYSTLFT